MTASGIYLDWNADAPVGDVRRGTRTLKRLSISGNPSSSHSPGRAAKGVAGCASSGGRCVWIARRVSDFHQRRN